MTQQFPKQWDLWECQLGKFLVIEVVNQAIRVQCHDKSQFIFRGYDRQVFLAGKKIGEHPLAEALRTSPEVD